MASHEDDFELVVVGTDEGDECEDFDFAFKLDNMDRMAAGVYTASDKDHTVWIEIELFESDENEVNDFEILDADPAIAHIAVKQPNEGGGISHLSFCYDESMPTPTPTPTGDVGGGTPTPTPTASPGGVLGGNPTPAAGGQVPNTATDLPSTSGATLFLALVALASLGALAYGSLTEGRARR